MLTQMLSLLCCIVSFASITGQQIKQVLKLMGEPDNDALLETVGLVIALFRDPAEMGAGKSRHEVLGCSARLAVGRRLAV